MNVNMVTRVLAASPELFQHKSLAGQRGKKIEGGGLQSSSFAVMRTQ